MSRLYNTVKRYYSNGIYTKEDVYKFVKAGKITKEEYVEIICEEDTDKE